jgi:hypothetical protein
MRYVITDNPINKVEKISKLIGIYKLNTTESLYIYELLIKGEHRFIHNKYNKFLFNSVDNVILFLSKIKENYND